MKKIVGIKDAIKISNKLRSDNKIIVLAGGCFDILHIGHITFLTAAKKEGDILLVLLESDETIKKTKGKNRPINNQEERAVILANLELVDFVLPLPHFEKNNDYDNLIISLKPAIIATSKGDPTRIHKERQAKLIRARVIDVTDQIVNQSTTKLINILNEI